jgi:hypothetical protein
MSPLYGPLDGQHAELYHAVMPERRHIREESSTKTCLPYGQRTNCFDHDLRCSKPWIPNIQVTFRVALLCMEVSKYINTKVNE